MKKITVILLVASIIISSLTMNVFAASAVEEQDAHFHNQDEPIALAATYPPCPNDSTHRGRGFMNLGAGGHLVYCKICNATIMTSDEHMWSIDVPDCTTGKYCILCNYNVPGQGALGHDIYPDQDNQYIAINQELHGHVCERPDCIYNPESYDYYYTEGYLVDEPYGPHMYFSSPRYESYAGVTDGLWRHKKYRDCAFCDYSEYMGWYMCEYNNPNCDGGCID